MCCIIIVTMAFDHTLTYPMKLLSAVVLENRKLSLNVDIITRSQTSSGMYNIHTIWYCHMMTSKTHVLYISTSYHIHYQVHQRWHMWRRLPSSVTDGLPMMMMEDASIWKKWWKTDDWSVVFNFCYLSPSPSSVIRSVVRHIIQNPFVGPIVILRCIYLMTLGIRC